MEMAGQAITAGTQRPLLASRSGLKTPRGDSHSVYRGCSGLLLPCGQKPRPQRHLCTRTNQLLRSQIHAPPGPWALGEDPWAAAAQHSSTATRRSFRQMVTALPGAQTGPAIRGPLGPTHGRRFRGSAQQTGSRYAGNQGAEPQVRILVPGRGSVQPRGQSQAAHGGQPGRLSPDPALQFGAGGHTEQHHLTGGQLRASRGDEQGLRQH